MPTSYPTVDGVEVLLPAPPGYIVNLEHPRRNGDIAAYWAFGIGNLLALFFLGQRLYTKLFLGDGLQREDFFILVSWITSEITQCILIYEFAEAIEGVHGWELPITKYKTFLWLSWLGPWIYVLCGSFAKLSLLTVCFRLSPFGWFRRATQLSLALVIAHTVVLVFLMVFSCIPVQKSWDITVPPSEGHCIDVVALYFATAIANILTDAILMVMPIPLILGLNMPGMQKIGFLVIFTFASGTLVTSIVRCAYLPSLLGNPDETWAIGQASICAIIEANLVIICASTTTLRRFLNHVAPTVMGYAGSGQGEAKSFSAALHHHRRGPLSSSGARSKRRRDPYSQVREDLELFSINARSEACVEAGLASDDASCGDGRGGGKRGGAVDRDETGSDKGILQTRTVAVMYREHRPA